ncbi:hypothetical protein [Cryptosporangium sp. NPDC051539]|uniref:hypothetical protein n=1 Tax=Cryptosporangium sp. NPDC051539 TaxID=3363962 RepID=UPI0037931FB5
MRLLLVGGVISSAVVVAGVPASAQAAPGATLVQATVSFHTNNEDKDHDTHVSVVIRDRDQTEVAAIDNDFGQFRDNSDSGPINLVIMHPSTWDALRSGAATQVTISPNGHDTWRFNFHLDLLFSDHTHLGANVTGIELAQDRNTQTWGVH